MEPEKHDRRTRKTRQQLRSALLALLKEKHYEEISVQDIIERADVARSTFYMHYVDKNDLLTGGKGIFAENIGHQMTAHTDGNRSTAFSSRNWFYHVQAQAEILKVIAKDPAIDLAMKTLRGIIHRNIQEELQLHAPTANDAAIPLSVMVDYMTDSLMSLIQWWVTQGMKQTPDEMDEMFQTLVAPGLASVLKGHKNEAR
jgi:AcrR family transcriptional regulator